MKSERAGRWSVRDLDKSPKRERGEEGGSFNALIAPSRTYHLRRREYAHCMLKSEAFMMRADTLRGDLVPVQERGQIGDDLPKYLIVWGNVSFHRSNIARQRFAAHNRFLQRLDKT